MRMEIRLANGNVLTAGSEFPRGNPENPVATVELEDKFRGLVEPSFGAKVVQRSIELVHHLSSVADMARVFSELP